jgi:hypothetical protein
MNDNPAHEPLPYDSGWERLSSTSQLLADTNEEFFQTMNDANPGPAEVATLTASQLLAAAHGLWSARGVRDRIFGRDLFPNPAWNILLDLFIAGEEGRSVTIKSACAAAGVPQSTALRYIAHLIEVRLAARQQHPSDARSAHLRLSERGRRQMVTYLSLTAASRDRTGA